MALGLGRSYFYCGRVRRLGYGGRLFNRFRGRLPCAIRCRVVLLEAAVLVLAAPAAMARLVAFGSSDRRCGHRTTRTFSARCRLLRRGALDVGRPRTLRAVGHLE